MCVGVCVYSVCVKQYEPNVPSWTEVDLKQCFFFLVVQFDIKEAQKPERDDPSEED